MEAAREAILHVVRRDPHQLGEERARWTQAAILRVCPWLRLCSPASLSVWLKRQHISYQRARGHVHSPDEAYLAKLQTIRLGVEAVRIDPKRNVLLFADEFSYERQPSLSQAYAAKGEAQPQAELGHTTNRVWRVVATLDARSGRVCYLQQGKITVPALVRFYQQVCQAYPQAQTIYLVVDNWPVHFHPDVRAALQPQWLPFPVYVPANWPSTPSRQAQPLNLPIQLMQLPTYASWCNPIEKLWRKLRQEELHLHRLGDDWDGLRRQVAHWLDQFAVGSQDLLRYVGLSDLGKLYQTAFDRLGLSPPV